MAAMNLLSEIERQQRALSELPADYKFPLFNARRALESQRRSGYRSTAAAAREIVDNSVQAGATLVDVVFAQSYPQGKRVVTDLAFIDNGPGMVPAMSRLALSWGGGTRFDDTSGIGRFGFGLPNASINQTKLVEVYSRVNSADPIYKAWLDLSEFGDYEQQSVLEPVEAELPDFVAAHLKRSARKFDHGVVVCWRNPDRLTYKKAGPLKEHLLDDFGSAYRYLLKSSTNSDGVQVVIEGVAVEPVDPLFLMSSARLFLPEEQGGAMMVENRILPVGVEVDAETGEERLRLLQGDEDVVNVIRATTFQIKIARFPVGFVAIDHKTADPDAQRRGEIRKGRRGISFVRGGRELQTIDAFPRSRTDISSGLGRWPLLQSYAYHWGVEITFGSELDDVFGITNDKQGVRPSEDFWRVLTEAGVDESLRRENAWQVEKRARQVPKPSTGDSPTAAERSAAAADTAAGTPTRVPPRMLEIARVNLERAVETKATATGANPDEVRAAIRKEAERRRFRVEYVEEPYAPFYTPMWIGDQVVIRINTASAFYRVLYGDLMRLRGGQRAKEAVDVLLIALGKAELSTDDDEMRLWYETQRTQRWSPYLDTAIRSLQQQFPIGEDALAAQDDTGGETAA